MSEEHGIVTEETLTGLLESAAGQGWVLLEGEEMEALAASLRSLRARVAALEDAAGREAFGGALWKNTQHTIEALREENTEALARVAALEGEVERLRAERDEARREADGQRRAREQRELLASLPCVKTCTPTDWLRAAAARLAAAEAERDRLAEEVRGLREPEVRREAREARAREQGYEDPPRCDSCGLTLHPRTRQVAGHQSEFLDHRLHQLQRRRQSALRRHRHQR